jgi:hypothetical protein
MRPSKYQERREINEKVESEQKKVRRGKII